MPFDHLKDLKLKCYYGIFCQNSWNANLTWTRNFKSWILEKTWLYNILDDPCLCFSSEILSQNIRCLSQQNLSSKLGCLSSLAREMIKIFNRESHCLVSANRQKICHVPHKNVILRIFMDELLLWKCKSPSACFLW